MDNRLVPVSVQPENCSGRHSQPLQEGSLKPPQQFRCSCRAFELMLDSSSSRPAIYGEPWPGAHLLSPFPSQSCSFETQTHIQFFAQTKGLCSIILLPLHNLAALVLATQELVLYSRFDRQAASQV